MLKIKNGKLKRPQKVGLYGAEGVGKTTLAAKFPDPLFIDTEGGTAQMDVRRIDSIATWEELLEVVREIAVTPNICKTLVLDTADWAERLEMEYVCRKNKWNSIESPGYGRGYQICGEEFGRLLNELDKVIDAGIHVVITAHAKMRKFEQPDEMGAYDRWEMKLSKQVAPLLKEWCDMLLFCNYQTYVVQGASPMEKAKVQGGKRVMHASHHPCWDAKNRHGLPDVMDLDYKFLAHIFSEQSVGKKIEDLQVPTKGQEQTLAGQIKEKLKEAHISTDAFQQMIAAKTGHAESIDRYPEEFITKQILPYWDRIITMITNAGGNNDGE